MVLGPAYGDGFAGNANNAINPEGDNVLYIVGDEFTDGSIRIAFTTGQKVSRIEARARGVWNDDGLRVASSSLDIGLDMTLSAVAGHLETDNPSASVGHNRGLIPHIEFDDSGTRQLETPIVDTERIFTVFGPAVGEITGTTIGIQVGTTPGRIIEESIHEVGATVPTTQVVVSFYTGTDNTGFLFNRRVMPPDDFVANTTLEINYDLDLGFEANVPIFMEFKSDTPLSLKTDAGGNPLTKHEAHELNEMGTLTENLIYDNDFDYLVDINLDPVYGRQFA